MVLAILRREALDLAGFVEPRKVHEAFDATVFAVDLKTFLHVAANRYREVEMAKRTAGKIRFDEPAIGVALLDETGAYGGDLAAEQASGVHEMAAVREDEIAALVGFGIALGFARLRARAGNRLKIVRHRVTVSRIVIPRFEGEHLAYLLPDKISGKGNARIKTAIVADLENELRFFKVGAQRFAFLDADAERLFNQYVFSGCDGFAG